MKKKLFMLLCLFSTLITVAQTYNLSQAKEAIDARNYDKALDYLNRDLKDFPAKAESHYYRAYTYNCQEKYPQALTEISASFKLLSPKDRELKADSYELRGKIYAIIDNQEKAIENYDQAIKLNPQKTEYYLSRGEEYAALKQYDKAEADYNKVLSLNEGDLKARTGLGSVCLMQKKYEEAEKIFTELMKLAPEYPKTYYFMAKVFLGKKETDDAIGSVFHALVLDESDDLSRADFLVDAKNNYLMAKSYVNSMLNPNPEKFFWRYLSAQLSEQKEDYHEAIKEYTKALETATVKDKNDVLYNRANCYTESGMYKHALVDYDEALSSDSTLAYFWGFRGLTEQQIGDFNGAVIDFTKAISVEPLESWFYYRRGWILDEFLKNHKAGLHDYNQSIAINKEVAYTYLNRGRLYSTVLNDSARAKKDFEMILTLDTVVHEQGNCRQYALMELGRNEDATVWMNKIIEVFPISGNYYDAACLYSKMNKPVKSVNSLRLAFENGYRSIHHINSDDDLDNVRNLKEFKELVVKWTVVLASEEKIVEETNPDNPVTEKQSFIIPMKNISDGTYELACKINELPLNFMFDTGASDISISQTEVQFMLKNGYMKQSDILGSQRFQIANGEIEIGTNIILRKVEIGGYILHNVAASVINNKKAPLLFGQSALSKYGKILIDNQAKTITIGAFIK